MDVYKFLISSGNEIGLNWGFLVVLFVAGKKLYKRHGDLFYFLFIFAVLLLYIFHETSRNQ